MKRVFIYFIATNEVKKNQALIVRHSKKLGKIVLHPKPPFHGGGSIDHYYHFMVDLILPLFSLTNSVNSDCVFYVKKFGVLFDKIGDIFGQKVVFFDELNDENFLIKESLVGMNPMSVRLDSDFLDDFVFWFAKKVGADLSKSKDKVVLVERGSPDPHFFSPECKYTGAGSYRRSIRNHAELKSFCQTQLSRSFDFHNVMLEDLSFKQQVELFNGAALLIGQHGAGLLNCLWCNPNARVIEINSGKSKLKHFEILAKKKNLNHSFYFDEADHTDLNLDDFSNFLHSHEDIMEFFKESQQR